MKKRTLNGQPRAALIASHAFADAAKPDDVPAPEPTSNDVDDQVTKAIDAAIEVQEKDQDVTDPADVKVLELLKEAKAAQAKDDDEPAEESAPEKPAVTAAGENPTDDEGEPKCANCQHTAAAHPEGGACSMENCECPKLAKPEAEKLAAPGVPGAPGVATTDPDADTAHNAPPEVEDPENLGPEFSGVLVIEAQPTGDGREIAADALTWRDLPLPLMLLATETHDPEGFDMNDPAVICGRIMSLSREPGEGSTQLIHYGGNFLATDDGMYAAELTEQMGRLGVSADIAVQASEVTITEVDDMGFPMDGTDTLTEGTVMGGTVCPFPAFSGCYIVLGDGTDAAKAKAMPQAAEDRPEVPDSEPAVVANGGQLINLMSYEDCEACDQGLEVIVASGAGPTRPPASWFDDPAFTEDDGRLVEILGRDGHPEDKYACPITVTADGRVFGHIAPWGICHKGISGDCVLAPHSAVDYAHFKTAKHILTAEGEKVRVGVLTADTGHASTRLSAGAAIAHYDDTGTVVADVNVGEDEYGIWVAGAIRPDATEEQIRKLTASAISGDWRNIGGQLELVHALCVNEPGFALAQVASGQRESLVAYGASVMEQLKRPREEVDMVKLAAPAMRRLAQRDARERIARLTGSNADVV